MALQPLRRCQLEPLAQQREIHAELVGAPENLGISRAHETRIAQIARLRATERLAAIRSAHDQAIAETTSIGAAVCGCGKARRAAWSIRRGAAGPP